MAIGVAPEQPRQLAGGEERSKLAGEPAGRLHGVLTSRLYAILERADPSRETFGDLECSLKEAFEYGVTVKVTDAVRGQVVLAGSLVSRANELMVHLGEQRARQIVAGLEEVITQREQQGDYWPEGRLNLGIAYACLGEYENARRWLDDAVNMLEAPSYIPRSEQMAA